MPYDTHQVFRNAATAVCRSAVPDFLYDVKGRKYIKTPVQYYYTDPGLRNARLGFRQIEETHLMENVLYNDLVRRGYDVDVGVVEVNTKGEDGKNTRKQLEVDFVLNRGDERCYIQSALSIDEPSKKEQEIASLMSEKWRSFGWHPIDVDGHNHDELRSAFSENSEGKPKVIISHTIKGHGAWRSLRAATSIPFGLYER